MKYVFWILIAAFAVACKRQTYKNPHIEIQTRLGDFEVELFPDQAPKTVAAFLNNIDSGLYNNTSFYRVLSRDNQPIDAEKTEFIQGGVWKKHYKRAEALKGIPHERTAQTKILHKDGVISMARLEPGTATSEFFICIGDQPGLDYGGSNNADKQGYAAFGRVVRGMDIVRQIHRQREYEQSFDPPVDIFDIVRL